MDSLHLDFGVSSQTQVFIHKMIEDELENNDQPASSLPWASLRYRDFRLLFAASLFVTTAQQMRLTQNLYQVYELSGSAFQLGLTGLAQGVPLFAVGLFAGTLADFMDRRKLLLLTIGGNLLVAVALGILTITGAIQVWHILVGTALTSAVNIVLNPTRMAMISRLVPRSHLTNAVSLNSSVSQSSHFIGPMLAGLSLAWMDAGNAYLLNALFYVPSAAGIFLLKTSRTHDHVRESLSVRSILGGVRFLWWQPVVFALVLLDFTIIGVGYYRPLLPIFAKDIFNVGPAGFGLLASAPAVGGMLGVLVLLVVGDIRHKGLLALWSFLLFSLCLGVFCAFTKLLGGSFTGGRFRADQFAAGGDAPNSLSPSYAGPSPWQGIFRFQHVFPRGQFCRSHGSGIRGVPYRRSWSLAVRERYRPHTYLSLLGCMARIEAVPIRRRDVAGRSNIRSP